MKLPLIFALVFALLAGSYTTPVEDTKATTPTASIQADAIAANDAPQADINPKVAPLEHKANAIDASDDFTVPKAKPESIANAIAAGTQGNDTITAKKAKEIALAHAGLAAKKVRDLETEIDKERGKVIYEVSFENGKFDFEYEIDAKSGEILTINKEWDD